MDNRLIMDDIKCLCVQINHLERIANDTVDWLELESTTLLDIKGAYAILAIALENAVLENEVK